MPDKTPSEIAIALTVASIQSGQITVTAENVCEFYEKVFDRVNKFSIPPIDKETVEYIFSWISEKHKLSQQ
ncbi:MAG: hypothetical protein IJQ47_10690 [Synergistaceae bacterium]|nr:hypothetical protein [Synergistaceae bacterium]